MIPTPEDYDRFYLPKRQVKDGRPDKRWLRRAMRLTKRSIKKGQLDIDGVVAESLARKKMYREAVGEFGWEVSHWGVFDNAPLLVRQRKS